MTSDEKCSTLVCGPGGTSVLVPNTDALKREARNRMKPICEVALTAKAKKIKTAMRKGVAQTLTVNNIQIQIEIKPVSKPHCSFCNVCEKLKVMSVRTCCYILTKHKQQIGK